MHDHRDPAPRSASRVGRTKRRRVLLAAAALAVVAASLAGLTIAEAARARAEHHRHAAPGVLVSVDGADLHLHCMGVGSPTILLEGGLGTDVHGWSWIQPRLTRTTRVCAHDRPGYGWSDYLPADGDPSIDATRLATALEAAGEGGSYVLVGHSLGGHYARAFATLYPDLVEGIVLVDARHPAIPAIIDGHDDDVRRTVALMRAGELLAPLGAVRWLSGAGALVGELPPTVRASATARLARRDHVRRYRSELEALRDLDAATARLPHHGSLPLLVIAAGAPMEAWPDEFWDAVAPLQERFTHLSNAAGLTVVDAADHVGILTREAAALETADAIAAFLSRIRESP